MESSREISVRNCDLTPLASFSPLSPTPVPIWAAEPKKASTSEFDNSSSEDGLPLSSRQRRWQSGGCAIAPRAANCSRRYSEPQPAPPILRRSRCRGDIVSEVVVDREGRRPHITGADSRASRSHSDLRTLSLYSRPAASVRLSPGGLMQSEIEPSRISVSVAEKATPRPDLLEVAADNGSNVVTADRSGQRARPRHKTSQPEPVKVRVSYSTRSLRKHYGLQSIHAVHHGPPTHEALQKPLANGEPVNTCRKAACALRTHAALVNGRALERRS